MKRCTESENRGIKMEKKWMKIFNEKNIAVVMVIIFILSVIPLLIMAKYNIIQCDDFAYGYSTHKNWNGTIASCQM